MPRRYVTHYRITRDGNALCHRVSTARGRRTRVIRDVTCPRCLHGLIVHAGKPLVANLADWYKL